MSATTEQTAISDQRPLPSFAGYLLRQRLEPAAAMLRSTASESSLNVPPEEELKKGLAGLFRHLEQDSLEDLLQSDPASFLFTDRQVVSKAARYGLCLKKCLLSFLPDFETHPRRIIELVSELDRFVLDWEESCLRREAGKNAEPAFDSLALVTDELPALVYIYDLHLQRDVYQNQGMQELLRGDGETNSEGQPLLRHIHPDDLPDLEAHEEKLCQSDKGSVESVRYRLRQGDGQFRWVRAIEKCLGKDESGRMVRKLGLLIDVNEHKLTSERLRESEHLYKQAEALTHIGNYVLRIPTGELRWSEELYRIYGLQPSTTQLSSHFCEQFDDPRDEGLSKRELEEAIAGKRPFDYYHRIRSADGQEKILHSRGRIELDEAGEPSAVLGTVQDVTEKQSLIGRLRHRDELYSQAEALANMGNYILDMRSGEVEWTDQLYRIYGLEPQSETITLDRFLSFVHPQDRESVQQELRRLEDKGSCDFIFRIMTDEGEIRSLRSIAHRVEDEQGRPSRIIGTEQDITERQDLVQKLQRSESLYRQAERMASMGNWSWDLITNKLEWTDQLYRIYGLEPGEEEMTIEKFLSFIHPEDREEVEHGVDLSFTETELDYTFRILLRDGQTKTLRSISRVHRDENGIPVFVVGTEHDVTERQLLMEQFRHRDHLYKQAQQMAHIGNWSWNLAADKVEWSDELYRIFGLEPQSIRIDLDTYASLLHPKDREMVIGRIQQALSNREPYEFYHRVLLRDGNERVIHSYGEVLLGKDGEPAELVGTAQDMTEYQNLIDKLKQSQQLYQQAQQMANIGNWTWEVETGRVHWSDELYDIYEMERGLPVTFELVASYMHPEDRGMVMTELENTRRTGHTYDVHHRIVLQDGRIKIIHRRAQAVRNAEGKVVRLVGITQDVTERQNLIDQLRESESLYKQAQNLAHIGNWSLDVAARSFTWSEEMYRIFEWPAGEKISFEEWGSFIHPDDYPATAAAFERCLHGAGHYDQVHRILLRDGRVKTVHCKAEAPSKGGMPRQVLGTTQDVTEQHRIQQELKDNQTFIRKITDATPSIIASYNVNTGQYVFISGGLEKLLGYPPSEVIEKGMSFFDGITHPEDRPVLEEKRARALKAYNQDPRQDGVLEFTFRMRHSAGHYRWFHTYGTVFDRNREGRIEHVLNITLDVTEQVEAMQTIRDQEHFIQQIADASPTILYLWDVEQDSMAYINREVFFVLGYVPEEIVEAGAEVTRMLYHPEDYDLLPERRASKATFQQTDSMIQYECRMRAKDGEWRWLLVREISFKRDAEGRITQILGAALDINKRKEMERTLLQNSFMLEQSNASLEEFAYVASHDLKEPLRKISTFGDRLMNSEGETMSPNGKVYLRKIVEASQRMQTMIQDLLSISMISGNRDFELYPLQKILEDTLQNLEFKIEQQNALIVSDELPEVEIIPSQFRQLFQNLLSNSLKFTREGLRPQINIRYAALDREGVSGFQVADASRYHRIEISDNGIGFENEFAGKIFAIFQRLHGRSEYEGSGIGLAICKKIVEHHGGFIFARGEAGAGSTFTIILPA